MYLVNNGYHANRRGTNRLLLGTYSFPLQNFTRFLFLLWLILFFVYHFDVTIGNELTMTAVVDEPTPLTL